MKLLICFTFVYFASLRLSIACNDYRQVSEFLKTDEINCYNKYGITKYMLKENIENSLRIIHQTQQL